MIALTLGLALVHPILMCGMAVVVALSLLTQGGSVTSVALSGAVVTSAPLAAAVMVESMYRWCFSTKVPRALPLLAAVVTLVFLLEDRAVVPALSAGWIHTEGLTGRLLTMLSALTASVALASAIIMLGALLLELPLRWATATFGGWEAEGLARTVRMIALFLVIGLGWPLFRDLPSETVERMLRALGG